MMEKMLERVKQELQKLNIYQNEIRTKILNVKLQYKI
jgi:hypothetical protein